jgi:uncharacterized membrane protein
MRELFFENLKKYEWPILLCMLLAATGLRFCNLDATSLWLDEIYSMLVANLHTSPPVLDSAIHPARHFVEQYLSWQPMKLDRLLEVLKINVHVPLYYVLLNPWLEHFGVNSTSLRSFSVLFSSLTLIPVYFLGRAFGGRGTAFFSCFAMAVLPFQLYFAQEGRMYSLALFWSCLSSLALWKILYSPRPSSWSIPYAISLLGGIFSHYIFIFFMCFHALYGIVWLLKTKDLQRLKFFTPAFLVILLAFWLWFPIYQIQKQGVDEDYHFAKGTVNWLRYASSLVWQPMVAVAGDNTLERIFYIPVLLGLSLLAILQTAFSFRKEGFLAFWVWVPLVVQIVYDLLNHSHTVVVDRYILLISPAMTLWFALGMEKLSLCARPRWVGSLMLMMLALAVANVWAHSPFRDEHNKKDTRGKLMYMVQNARPGDLVLVNGPYGASALAAYYLSRTLPNQPMLYWTKTHRGRQYALPDATLFKPYKRVWLFRYRTNKERGQQELRDLVGQSFPKLTRPQNGNWWLYSR